MKKEWMITGCAILILCIAGGTAMSLAPYRASVAANARPVAKEKEYGLSTTLSGADCYLDRLDDLKKDGMTHVELCLREDYAQQQSLYADALNKINASGLKVWSVHLPFGETVDPAAADETQRLKNVAKIKQFIDLTKDSGTSMYVIHGSAEPVRKENRAARLEASIRSLGELTAYLKGMGLPLALENLPRSCIGNTMEEIAYMLGKLPDTKLCFDTNHFTLPNPNYSLRPVQRLFPSLRKKWNPVEGSPVDYVKKHADRIATVHISDYDEIDECHWIPGQGTVDFHTIHTTLKQAGFTAPIVFEPNETCKGVRTTGKRLIQGYEKTVGMESPCI